MFMRCFQVAIFATATLVSGGHLSAAGPLDVQAAGQSVRFRIVIPEVNPLQLNARSLSLSGEQTNALAGEEVNATAHVVEDRFGRYHLRHVRQSSAGVRTTLATP